MDMDDEDAFLYGEQSPPPAVAEVKKEDAGNKDTDGKCQSWRGAHEVEARR